MNKRRRHRLADDTNRAGWRVADWTDSVGCSRATTCAMVARGIVPSVKVGGMRIITLSPADFLARAAADPITIQPPKPMTPSASRGRPRKYPSPVSTPAAPVAAK